MRHVACDGALHCACGCQVCERADQMVHWRWGKVVIGKLVVGEGGAGVCWLQRMDDASSVV